MFRCDFHHRLKVHCSVRYHMFICYTNIFYFSLLTGNTLYFLPFDFFHCILSLCMHCKIIAISPTNPHMTELSRRVLAVLLLLLISVFPLCASFYCLKFVPVKRGILDSRLLCRSAPNMHPEQEPKNLRDTFADNFKRQPRNILRLLSAFTLLKSSLPVSATYLGSQRRV